MAEKMLPLGRTQTIKNAYCTTVLHVEEGAFNVPFDILNRIAVVLGGELKIVINEINE